MPEVHFTAHLRSIAGSAPVRADGPDVRTALHAVFERNPQLEGYVLDERGALRRHVCIFLDGERLPGDSALNAPVHERSEIYVMQALSGG